MGNRRLEISQQLLFRREREKKRGVNQHKATPTRPCPHIVHVVDVGLGERWEVLLGPDGVHLFLDGLLAPYHVGRDDFDPLLLHEASALDRHVVPAQGGPHHAPPQGVAVVHGDDGGVGGARVDDKGRGAAICKPDWTLNKQTDKQTNKLHASGSSLLGTHADRTGVLLMKNAGTL